MLGQSRSRGGTFSESRCMSVVPGTRMVLLKVVDSE